MKPKTLTLLILTGIVMASVACSSETPPPAAQTDKIETASTSISTLPEPAKTNESADIKSIVNDTPSSISDIALNISDNVQNLPDYDRDDWNHWTDADRDCQNTRHEVLIEESLVEVTFKSADGCQVATGKWVDKFTGETITDATSLDVDHMVPLKNAHDSGAWAWDKSRKKDFANNMSYSDHLIAVSSSANRSKGSRGPDQWKPSDKSYWCDYVLDWIQIKEKWDLTVTSAEWDAIQQMLTTCDSPPNVSAQLSKQSTSASNKTVVKDVQVSGTGDISISSIDCSGKPEVLVIKNNGTSPQDLTGWRIEDEGAKYTHTFDGGFSIAAGNTVEMISGGDGESTDTKVYWNGRSVWNNDGDTAYIFSSSGDLVDQKKCP